MNLWVCMRAYLEDHKVLTSSALTKKHTSRIVATHKRHIAGFLYNIELSRIGSHPFSRITYINMGGRNIENLLSFQNFLRFENYLLPD